LAILILIIEWTLLLAVKAGGVAKEFPLELSTPFPELIAAHL